MKDPETFLPIAGGGRAAATPEQIAEIKRLVDAGLAADALGVGFGLQYTPGATKYEVLEMFRAKTLAMVAEARAHGLDVTAEAYPYIAGLTEISSPLLDRFVGGPDTMFAKLMLVSTGERLTRETFAAKRTPGAMVILFLNTREVEPMATTTR